MKIEPNNIYLGDCRKLLKDVPDESVDLVCSDVAYPIQSRGGSGSMGGNITRRLGCLCCPLKSQRKRLEDFKRYPKMLRQYIRNANLYFDEHPNGKVHEWAADIYEWVFAEIMCQSHKKYMEQYKNGLFQVEDGWHKRKLEEYFNVNLDF